MRLPVHLLKIKVKLMTVNRFLIYFIMLFSVNAITSLSADEGESYYTDLHHLYERARLNDPRMISAEAMDRRAQYRERESFSRLLPQVSADARVARTNYDGGRVSEEYTGHRYSVNLTQVLFDRSVWQGYQRNRALSIQQTEDAQERRNIAAADLVQRYFEVLAAEDSLTLVQAEQRVVVQNLTRVESLFEKQMVPVTDLLEVTARKDRLRSEELQASNSVELARESLAELVGQEVYSPLKRLNPDIDITQLFELKDLDYWQQTALTNNPYLLSKYAETQASLAGYREARGGHYPRVTFTLSSQKTNIGFENSSSPTTQSDVAAINFQLPIFSGGGVSARSGAAYEDIIISEQQFEASRREVLRETRSAFLNVQSSYSRIHAAQRALESAEKARVAAERSFNFGLTNAVDVLDRARDEFSAQSELLGAKYSFLLAYTLLRRWSGEFDNTDIELLNRQLKEIVATL